MAFVVQSALASYRHELFVENFRGIPILQQHGSDDNNVPVFHSRRLNQLVSASGQKSTYVEIAGKGHWFAGVMTTQPLIEFYANISLFSEAESELPVQFSIVIPNSGNMGSRGGIVIDQLMSPDQLGKVIVDRNQRSWSLKTSNIHRFHLSSDSHHGQVPGSLIVDGQSFTFFRDPKKIGECWFVRSKDGSWTVSDSSANALPFELICIGIK